MILRMKDFIFLGLTDNWKIQILGGWHEKPRKRLPKQGGLGKFIDLRRGTCVQERDGCCGVFEEEGGGWYPNAHYVAI